LASSIFPVFVGVVRLSQENRSPIKISSKYWSIGYELFRGDYVRGKLIERGVSVLMETSLIPDDDVGLLRDHGR
jgi:hypothetical protein